MLSLSNRMVWIISFGWLARWLARAPAQISSLPTGSGSDNDDDYGAGGSGSGNGSDGGFGPLAERSSISISSELRMCGSRHRDGFRPTSGPVTYQGSSGKRRRRQRRRRPRLQKRQQQPQPQQQQEQRLCSGSGGSGDGAGVLILYVRACVSRFLTQWVFSV